MLLNVAVLEQGPYGVSPSEVARVGPSPTRPRPHRRGLNAGRTPQRAGGQGRAGAGVPRRWHEGRRGHQSWERARRRPSPRAAQDVAPRAPRPWPRRPPGLGPAGSSALGSQPPPEAMRVVALGRPVAVFCFVAPGLTNAPADFGVWLPAGCAERAAALGEPRLPPRGVGPGPGAKPPPTPAPLL